MRLLASRWLGGGLPAIFAAMALALVVFGGTMGLALRLGAWGKARARS